MSKVIVATAISFKKKIFNTCDSHKDDWADKISFES